MLLDTTSVIGELGWKTYPVNGVRKTAEWRFCVWHSVSMIALYYLLYSITNRYIKFNKASSLTHSLRDTFLVVFYSRHRLASPLLCHPDSCTCAFFLRLCSLRGFPWPCWGGGARRSQVITSCRSPRQLPTACNRQRQRELETERERERAWEGGRETQWFSCHPIVSLSYAPHSISDCS